TGGQQLQAAPAIRGQDVRTDITTATRAAKAYLAASGMTGRVRVTGGDTITVDTNDSYTTTFLSIIGITTLPVTGHAEAKVTRTLRGVEQ
ncbi:MAG TPA: pilus assembly protein, partial [Phycicoccus sp.]|nr:pilus assembly protein [Phycicoccus sp.]